jgi:K+ transporter
VPNSLQWPVVAVATCAAIIASQALISGSFTIAQQVGAALVAWWVLGGGVC